MKSNKNRILDRATLMKGLGEIKKLKGEEKWTPKEALAELEGWEAVMHLLNTGRSFEGAAKELNLAWSRALANKEGSPAGNLTEIQLFSAVSLRCAVQKIAHQRKQEAESILRQKVTPEEKVEARKTLDEVNKLIKRYGWKSNPTPAARQSSKAPPAVPSAKTTLSKANGNMGDDKPKPESGIATQAAEPMKSEQSKDQESTPATKKDGVAAGVPPKAASPVVPSKPVAEKPAPATFTCPECGGEMRLKTIGRGKNAGKQFYGCIHFQTNKCAGARDKDGKDTTRR